MKILHTCTCTRFVEPLQMHEEFQRYIIRDRKLTLKGCQRILRREAGPSIHKTNVVAMQRANY